MSDDGVLEQALAAAEEQARASLGATAAVARELKRAQSSARDGQVRELRRSVAAARAQWSTLGNRLTGLAAAYDVDEAAYLAGGDFVRELVAEAASAGVAITVDPDSPDRLLCYPSVVRILPADAAVEVDKRRERRLRPSVLVARLRRGQQAPALARTEPFLESLAAGYDLVRAREGREPGSVVRLDSVWAVLTLLPGARTDYGRPEFARDLYRLDQSAVTVTKDGRRLRFAASSGTRGAGVLTTVARGGQPQIYWGVAFATADGAGAGGPR